MLACLKSTLMFVETWFGKGSVFAAFSNLVRSALGISLFLLPWTIAASGVVSGCCIVIGVLLLNAYRTFIVTSLSKRLTEQGVKSQTGCSDWWLLEGCLGGVKTGANTFVLVVFSFSQWITLLGNASVLFIFCGLNLSQSSPSLSKDSFLNVRLYTCLCVGIVVALHPLVQFLRARVQQSMENIGCSSACSVSLIMSLPSIITVLIFVPIILSYSSGQIKELDVTSFTDYNADRTCLAIALALFIFGASPDDVTSTFGTFFKSINFYIVIILATATMMVVGIGFGVPVLLGLQTSICGSVTLSLPSTGSIFLFVRIVSTMLAITVLLFKHQMDPKLTSRLTTGEIACDVMFKMIFLLAAGTIAVSVPILPGIAAVFGSTSSVILTIIFPFTADILMRINEDSFYQMENRSLIKRPEPSTTKTTSNKPLKWAMIAFNVLVVIGGFILIGFSMNSTVKYLKEMWKMGNTEATYCTLNITTH